jgi:hypothetical protein
MTIAFDASRAVWRKSSRSNGQGGNCVEVSTVDTIVGVRDSKDPSGPVLTFSPGDWRAFVEAINDGEFDR